MKIVIEIEGGVIQSIVARGELGKDGVEDVQVFAIDRDNEMYTEDELATIKTLDEDGKEVTEEARVWELVVEEDDAWVAAIEKAVQEKNALDNADK